ncbi:DUF664 domain-containing protein [Streptomyces purpureus]|uniref:mycothiol transferase n=1 Tax=Streptomyces purpureus TaxID=1951 RepID=UPI00036A378A|nr:DUF664 domain-containing protein [Streptomyces purpureus]
MPRDDHTRVEPPHTGGERATLAGILHFPRGAGDGRYAGLTSEQLRARAVPPSGLSPLGLVRHLAEVERSWFSNTLMGEAVAARRHRRVRPRPGVRPRARER